VDPFHRAATNFHNIGIGIIRHHVVPLARQAEKLVNYADVKSLDHAAIQSAMSVLGRFLITKKDKDTASFKTPTLRNLLLTAPCFHDGSQATLWDVVDHYNKGDGVSDPWLDEHMQPIFGEAAMFTAQLAGPAKNPMGMNSPEAKKNYQFLLNVVHWLSNAAGMPKG
jgi:cytochrome c peroxidase